MKMHHVPIYIYMYIYTPRKCILSLYVFACMFIHPPYECIVPYPYECNMSHMLMNWSCPISIWMHNVPHGIRACHAYDSCHTHEYTRFWAWWSNQTSKKEVRQSPTRILGKRSNTANLLLVSSIMLQCVAVSCSELQGSMLQRVAAWCSVLRIHHWSPLSFHLRVVSHPWMSRDCCTCQCNTSQ